MNRRPLLVASALLALAASAPLHAGVENHYAILMGQAVIPDASRDNKNGYGFLLGYGIPLSERSDLEFSGGGNFLRRQSDDQRDSFYSLGADLKFKLADMRGFRPFILGGLGGVREEEVNTRKTRPYADLGLGFSLPLAFDRLSLRAESRYHLVYAGSDAASKTFSDLHFNLGVQLAFAKPAGSPSLVLLDTDGDGVVDGQDRCPNTAAGTEVDSHGCPAVVVDSDADGVPDTRDLCPGTPPGARVDSTGCPAPVAAAPIIAEPAPAAAGTDADHDGVADVDDRCPGTPQGLKVGSDGCLVAQTTVVPGVEFESNSNRLTPRAKDVLKEVAASLKAQPGVRLEISGHTDSLGPQAANLTLSLNRAKAVENFLAAEGVESLRLQSEGYGEFIPVETNETEAGRAKNRRVEFKVLP